MQIINDTDETITLEPGEGIICSPMTRAIDGKQYRLLIGEMTGGGLKGPKPAEDLPSKSELLERRWRADQVMRGEEP